MKAVKLVLITLLAFFISGCATMENVADGGKVRDQQGLLVFKVTTAHPWAQLQYRKFSTNSSFGYFFAEELTGPDGAFLNKTGDTYWVKPVMAGEYMWSKLLVDNRYAIFHGSNKFTIKPGTITYVGHLTIAERGGSAHISVVDREDDIRSYLGVNFPQFSKTMPLEKSITDFRL